MKRSLRIIAAVLVSGLAAHRAAAQGGLVPPTGTPVANMKTLDQMEPRTPISSAGYVISQSGSYYLTTNLTAASGQNGITVEANDVAIDLNGFTLIGSGSDSGSGIYQSWDYRNLAVRNGKAVNWRGTDKAGIEAYGASSLFSSLQVVTNYDGIHASGTGSTVSGCTASDNNGDGGIYTGYGSTVSGCTASDNGGHGIYTGYGSTVSGCTASDNDGYGIATGSGSTVSGCTASLNGVDGIATGFGSTVSECTAYNNDGSGITGSYGSTVSGCTASYNGVDGIYAGYGSTVSGCTAYKNDGSGISAGDDSTVSGCTAYENASDGIEVSENSRVADNNCNSNGAGGDGAGIHVSDEGCRIEGNNVNGNARGLDVDGVHNLIICNSAQNNSTNYSIVAWNCIGPIVLAPATSTAVEGNTGGDGVGSTDPWANFSY